MNPVFMKPCEKQSWLSRLDELDRIHEKSVEYDVDGLPDAIELVRDFFRVVHGVIE